jgi:Flp pilus assembly protein TadG
MVPARARNGTHLSLNSRANFVTSAEASSLAEFAIALPLLVVLVVGIFDFGGAFNQKQELNTAVREGARFGAAQPTNDLAYTAAPPSIDAVRYLVDAYLLNSRINDCGLSTAAVPAWSLTGWVYTANTGCPGNLTLTIAKDPQFSNAGTGSPTPTCGLTIPAGTYGSPNPIPKVVNVSCTYVSISYPYQWHFNSVIQLLVPGSTIALTQIITSATAPNMN